MLSVYRSLGLPFHQRWLFQLPIWKYSREESRICSSASCFQFALVLAEEFNETSNFMCSSEKKGKWWSRNFGVYHHTTHGIAPCVTGCTQCDNMSAILEGQVRKAQRKKGLYESKMGTFWFRRLTAVYWWLQGWVSKAPNDKCLFDFQRHCP